MTKETTISPHKDSNTLLINLQTD